MSRPRSALALDDSERFIDFSPLPDRGSFRVVRARDLTLDRSVRLYLGAPTDVARILSLGAIEHPAICGVLDAASLNDGTRAAVVDDPVGVTPLPSPETRLRAPITILLRAIAHISLATAIAIDQGFSRNRIADADILIHQDGSPVLDGIEHWVRGDLIGDSTLGLKDILLDVTNSRAPKDCRLRRLIQDSSSPRQLAHHLLAYLEDHPLPLHVEGPLNRARRIARRNPRLTAACAGAILLSSAASVFHQSEIAAADTRDRLSKDRARSIQEAATEGSLASARETVSELGRIHASRLALQQSLFERYHQIESPYPDARERDMRQRLTRRDAEWEALARTASALAASVQEGPHRETSAAILREIAAQRVAFELSRSRFHESTTLSTQTIPAARATQPIWQDLRSANYDSALSRSADLSSEHPFRSLATLLSSSLSAQPDWRSDYREAIEALSASGRLLLSDLPAGASACYREVISTEVGRWALTDPHPLIPATPLTLPMGEYLVEVERGEHIFRFDVLVARGTDQVVRGSIIPSSIPHGYVWIPPSTLYVGGSKGRRYRLCSAIERAFFIRRNEVTWIEYRNWLSGLPKEDRSPFVPIFVHTGFSQPMLDSNLEVNHQMRVSAEDYFPIWGIDQPACVAFADSHSTPELACDLPTEYEWELASRGVAGRTMPWGDRYIRDVFFPKGIVSYHVPWVDVRDDTIDISVYGVRHLAAGVAEFTSTHPDAAHCVMKGRAIKDETGSFHSAESSFCPRGTRLHALGFRTVLRERRFD